jgi:hypothetical protein
MDRRKGDRYHKDPNIIPHDDPVLVEHYAEILAVFPDAVIVRKNDVVRFKQDTLMDFFCEAPRHQYPGAPDLNEVVIKYFNGQFTYYEMMLFWQRIGYSLSGYRDVFGPAIDKLFKDGKCLLQNGLLVDRESIKCEFLNS